MEFLLPESLESAPAMGLDVLPDALRSDVSKKGWDLLPASMADKAEEKGVEWSELKNYKPSEAAKKLECSEEMGLAWMRAMANTTRPILDEYGQEKVLAWLDAGKLTFGEASILVEELNTTAVPMVEAIWKVAITTESSIPEAEKKDAFLSPLKYAGSTEETKTEWRKAGLECVARGEAACLVLAGGQGTRLGFDGPKGCYQLDDVPSRPSLFELICKRLRKVATLAGIQSRTAHPKLLVMTSPLNLEATRTYFVENRFFGLDQERVRFFPQGTLPALKIGSHFEMLMSSPSSLASSPDGNGGVYKALALSGELDQLVEVDHCKLVHVLSVDNALSKPCDPVFLGFCLAKKSEAASKVVPKRSPDEKVGVLAMKNGRPCVVEYSELDARKAAETDPETNRLLYSQGNICNHCLSPGFLSAAATADVSTLPYHVARKAVPCVDPSTLRDDDGQLLDPAMVHAVKPPEPNAVKLETFIFDAFTLLPDHPTLDCDRADDFAPVKNAQGNDSPASAAQALLQRGARWLRQAGATVLGDKGCDVPPELSLDGEGLGHLQGRTFDASLHPLLFEVL